MSKITKASEDVINAIQSVAESMGIHHYARFFTLNITGQKQLVKVTKASPTTEYFSKTTDTVIVYVNEEVYDMLEPVQREMLIANALYGVIFDLDKDKLNVSQPELGISLAGYRKYGTDLINASEAVQIALQQIKEKKEEQKASKSKKKND